MVVLYLVMEVVVIVWMVIAWLVIEVVVEVVVLLFLTKKTVVWARLA